MKPELTLLDCDEHLHHGEQHRPDEQREFRFHGLPLLSFRSDHCHRSFTNALWTSRKSWRKIHPRLASAIESPRREESRPITRASVRPAARAERANREPTL